MHIPFSMTIAYVNLAVVNPILGRLHLPYTLTCSLSIFHELTLLWQPKFNYPLLLNFIKQFPSFLCMRSLLLMINPLELKSEIWTIAEK